MLVNDGIFRFMSILVVEIVWDWFAQAIKSVQYNTTLHTTLHAEIVSP
jgi:hypothetical protein